MDDFRWIDYTIGDVRCARNVDGESFVFLAKDVADKLDKYPSEMFDGSRVWYSRDDPEAGTIAITYGDGRVYVHTQFVADNFENWR